MNNTVLALTVFDDGTGAALYAGGGFTTAGGTPANHLAKWDGTQWSALGSGIGPPVYALGVFDDGHGPALYAAGLSSGPVKWDGSEWKLIGAEMNGQHALLAFDDGGGPALYVGGNFTQVSGVPARNIAKWDGTLWSAVGAGVDDSLLPVVFALAPFDDGGGPALYAGGRFTSAGGIPVGHIARWRCTQ
jgi:hypothetical protein